MGSDWSISAHILIRYLKIFLNEIMQYTCFILKHICMFAIITSCLQTNKICFNNGRIYYIITSYIRMLDSDWLLAVIFFTNSGLALWICIIFTSCRCICIRFNIFEVDWSISAHILIRYLKIFLNEIMQYTCFILKHICMFAIITSCLQTNRIITSYIRMLDSDWLLAVIFFTNSGLALWICRIFTSCRCICTRFNFLSLCVY
jgi:flagellar biosynthesis protein FlhB